VKVCESCLLFERPFVKRFSLFMDFCPVCLSVCASVCLSVCLFVILVYCGQTVGWTKMPLDMEVGLEPGHIVLDGDTVPPGKVAQCQACVRINCGPYLLWPSGLD